MTHPLLPLLDILRNPQSPGFAEAAHPLPKLMESFDPAMLSETERTSIMANLQSALTNIAKAKALTENELGLTQKRAQALQSYNRLT